MKPGDLESVILTCPSCGGGLHVTSDVDRFACAQRSLSSLQATVVTLQERCVSLEEQIAGERPPAAR